MIKDNDSKVNELGGNPKNSTKYAASSATGMTLESRHRRTKK